MKIHHLNCASLCPANLAAIEKNVQLALSLVEPYVKSSQKKYFARWNWDLTIQRVHALLDQASDILSAKFSLDMDLEKQVLQDLKELKSHCLLIESESGLILVDTGVGTKWRKEFWKHPHMIGFGMTNSLHETAIEQVKKRGFSVEDVKHIALTHLDFDHAGGVGDFPEATVHVLNAELEQAAKPRTLKNKQRYFPDLWENNFNWRSYDHVSDQNWNGLDNLQRLKGIKEDIFFTPLIGHTAGHAGVCIPEKNLVMAGDAYFHHSQLENPHYTALALKLLGKANTQNPKMYQHNVEKLSQVKTTGTCIFCSHDHHEWQELKDLEH